MVGTKRLKISQRKCSDKILDIKEFSEKFHNIGSVEDKMLEADPNLEKSVTIHQGRAKMLTPYHIRCYMMRRQPLFKSLFMHFF